MTGLNGGAAARTDEVFGDERTLPRPGADIRYWVRGPEDAPVVLFTHGATMDHEMFAGQVPALAARWRVVTWDVAGHGASRPARRPLSLREAADDAVAILDALGVEQAVLVGQSMGGMVVQHALIDHPQRVRAACVVGATCVTMLTNAWERRLLALTLPLLRLYPWKWLKSQTAKGAAVTPAAKELATRTLERLGRADFLHIWRGVTEGLRPMPDYRCDHPLLLVRGTEDTLGNVPKAMPRWHQRDANSRYVEIPGAGHMANTDQPGAFNQLLTEYLDGLPA